MCVSDHYSLAIAALPTGPDDECESASDQIISLEEDRAKGELGKLTPGFSKWLDKFKGASGDEMEEKWPQI